MKCNKQRIRLYGKHLAYLSNDLYTNFLNICKVIDYSTWIKEKALLDFGICLINQDSIDTLKSNIINNYYEDIGDWLREKMREEIYSNKHI